MSLAHPLCPLLLQARASIPFATGIDPAEAAKPIEGAPWVEYPDPTKAPGVACIGSRCAWWEREIELEADAGDLRRAHWGRCGHAPGVSFRPDPAVGGGQ